ncbi:hypothetical protein [Fervidobacterium thailandense]|uniref:DUF4258 domain-containing protein n=1 Tax=Fervidobacterium thailandense TaxID=1008305 RepID=A0A1E3G3L6_9BACT|nr:hypothetical protein [Fervidobacterium thailandense]ODN30847.1 hypothetical protein A4H02_02970 [Fervidobacterium thailandense]
MTNSDTKLKNDEGGEVSEIYINRLGRLILLTPHTFQRMIERSIMLDELVEMLESGGSKAILQKSGRIRITDGRITAILQLSFGALYVVTVFKNE